MLWRASVLGHLETGLGKAVTRLRVTCPVRAWQVGTPLRPAGSYLL